MADPSEDSVSFDDVKLEAYSTFVSCVKALDEQLCKLANSAQELGSSGGIVSAATRLRDRLRRIGVLFNLNAHKLFPAARLKSKAKTTPERKASGPQPKGFSYRAVKVLDEDPVTWEASQISAELHLFSRDVGTLVECFTQFPAFADEVPDDLKHLSHDLKFWAESVDELKDDFHTPAFHLFLYDSMTDIGKQLGILAETSIPIFIDVGIPTIRSSQEHSANTLDNLSTIATLFSSITATMVGFSYNAPPNESAILAEAVNVFWFTSLVFSIAAAVNSLLGLAWMQAHFRSPDRHVPWWVLIWVRGSPLVCLVLSVACFFVGLVLFMYSSKQARATSIITTVLSSISCFGLAAMSTWFGFEYLVYTRHDGRKWLGDVIHEKWEAFLRSSFVRETIDIAQHQGFWDSDKDDGDDRPGGRIGQGFFKRINNQWSSPPQSKTAVIRDRWKRAIEWAIEHNRNGAKATVPHDKSQLHEKHGHALHKYPLATTFQPSIRYETGRCVSMRITHAEPRTTGMIAFLRFSPDGKYLATSSYDGNSRVLEVKLESPSSIPENSEISEDARYSSPSKLAVQFLNKFEHGPDPGFVKQLQWSPNSELLLLRKNTSVTVLDVCGKLEKPETGDRTRKPSGEHHILSVAWIPSDSTVYWCVEGHKAIRVNAINGKEQGTIHTKEDFLIKDLVVTHDSNWMICVGKYETQDETRNVPQRRRGEHQRSIKLQKHEILMYNILNGRCVKAHRVANEISAISITAESDFVLISYADKADPQLWRCNGGLGLTLSRMYSPKDRSVEFSTLPAMFGGPNDEFVLRASIEGHIHFWDRLRGTFLCTVQAPAGLAPGLQRVTAFAWNRRAADYMFATGTAHGEVYIWTVPSEASPPLALGNDAQDQARSKSGDSASSSDADERMKGCTDNRASACSDASASSTVVSSPIQAAHGAGWGVTTPGLDGRDSYSESAASTPLSTQTAGEQWPPRPRLGPGQPYNRQGTV